MQLSAQIALTSVEGEPRIQDVVLAQRLGFDRPRKIRDLIARHRSALEQMGVCPTVEQTPGEKGGRPSTACYLNKKQAIFITAKSETPAATEITIEIIERFDAYERGIVPAPAISDDEMMARGFLIAGKKLEEARARIAELEPKADALDRIATADGSFCITDAAKALQVRPKDLFSYLREHGWTYKRVGSDHWVGYQQRTQAGDLEHKVTTVLRADGSEKITEQVRITAKGLAKLAKLMNPALHVVPPSLPLLPNQAAA